MKRQLQGTCVSFILKWLVQKWKDSAQSLWAIKTTTNSMHNEDPLGKSAWCKLAPWGCDFFKVSILVTFQGLNSYDFLQKCQTPLAVVLCCPLLPKAGLTLTVQWMGSCFTALHPFWGPENSVYQIPFFQSFFSQPLIVFQYNFSWLINNSNIAHISPLRHHRR